MPLFTVDELRHYSELSQFTFDELRTAVYELCKRGFLLVVQKPYGHVYAVNKLRISNMEFVYGAYPQTAGACIYIYADCSEIRSRAFLRACHGSRKGLQALPLKSLR